MLKKVFSLLCIGMMLVTITTIMKISTEEAIIHTIPIQYPEKIAKTKTIQVEQPIGRIIIPKIQINQSLYDINSPKNNIEENITILKESTFPDQENSLLFIAAHSGNTKVAFFQNLDQLQIGDEIQILYQNQEYEYNIIDIYEQEKNGYISGMRQKTKRQLILTTCCPNKDNCQLIINSIEKESH
ncbi:MAG: sortase [Bacilli bacterium]|nr:sortase [Bacilli bacterium]